jgi:glycosyltransferase involved in cell wall biosynthesis
MSTPSGQLRVGLLGYGLDRPGSGIARYAVELGSALAAAEPGIQVVLLKPFSGEAAGWHHPVEEIPLRGVGKLPAMMAWGPVAVAAAARRARLDVVPDPTGISPFLLPRRAAPFARVVTIHDMVPFVHPETHARLTNALFKRYIPRTLPFVDRIVTVSEASGRDISRFYRVPPARVLAVPNGVSPRFGPRSAAEIAAVAERYGVSPPYLLAVGALQARKNLETLFEAFARLRADGLSHRLVVVGRKMWKSEGIFQRLDALGLGEAVTLTGYVADHDLPALYAGAACFVFPSLYEGFGLPPLEAMACGTPVVVADTSSLPEVVDEAGVLVRPRDVAGFEAAIARVVRDDAWARRLGERGRARSRRFTWEAAAEAHAALYREVAVATGARRAG